MSLVSPTLPSPGDAANASDISTPINQLATVINGSIDDTNISAVSGSKIAAATVTKDKFSTATGELGGAWATWTPSWTDLTVGNGTTVARYALIGKTVHFYLKFTLGTTSSVGTAPTFSLPANMQSSDFFMNSMGLFTDANGSQAPAFIRNNSTNVTHARLAYATSTTAVANISATTPFTWAATDRIEISGTYEAA